MSRQRIQLGRCGYGWCDGIAMQLILHRGRRSSVVLPTVAIAAAWMFGFLYALLGASGQHQPDPVALLEMSGSSASQVQLLAVIGGIVMGCAETRPGLVPAGLLAMPRRHMLVLAKVVTSALWWGPAGMVSAAGAPIMVMVVLGSETGPNLVFPAIQMVIGGMIAAGMAAGIGTSIGIVSGSAIWSVAVSFVLFSLLPLLSASLGGPQRVLPGPALTGLVSPSWMTDLISYAVAIGWTALLAGLAVLSLGRREY